jgi:hypothetical protein
LKRTNQEEIENPPKTNIIVSPGPIVHQSSTQTPFESSKHPQSTAAEWVMKLKPGLARVNQSTKEKMTKVTGSTELATQSKNPEKSDFLVSETTEKLKKMVLRLIQAESPATKAEQIIA